jgi:hypothetical protein
MLNAPLLMPHVTALVKKTQAVMTLCAQNKIGRWSGQGGWERSVVIS